MKTINTKNHFIKIGKIEVVKLNKVEFIKGNRDIIDRHINKFSNLISNYGFLVVPTARFVFVRILGLVCQCRPC